MPARSALERGAGCDVPGVGRAQPAQRVKLARQALTISLDCADAYVLLAEETAKTPAEARAFYEQGVQAGERALGKEAFEELEGHFWGCWKPDPTCVPVWAWRRSCGHWASIQPAAEHLRAMLRLNPGDNQGVRYLLATLLLEIDDREALAQLLDQYPDDWSAHWKYSAALLAFRQAGKSDQADALLQAAIEYNRFVPAYLLGRKKPPKQLPAFISPGEDSEALEYARMPC